MSSSYYGQQRQQPGPGPYGSAAQPGWSVPPQNQGYTSYTSAPHFAETAGIPKSNVGFNDQSIRAGFVRKVFTLVALMLGTVALMSAIPFFHPPMMLFVRQNFWLYLVGYITFFVVYIALICSDSLRRSHPTNLICLAILTLSIGFMTMMITAYHTFASVFLCFMITAVSCGAVALFASVTKKDLTSMMGFMFIATMCLAMFGLMLLFVGLFTNIRTLYVVYAAIGAFLFMVWLAIDIQMIMGGRTYEISPEEHVFAAITVFLDIIQIFWFLLTIFGERNR